MCNPGVITVHCIVSLIVTIKKQSLVQQIRLLHLHLVILQMLLSKATWGIHKTINLEEANRQRKCP